MLVVKTKIYLSCQEESILVFNFVIFFYKTEKC